MGGLNFGAVRRLVREQQDAGHCARFTGGCAKVVPKKASVTKSCAQSRGHLLMLAAVVRGIKEGIVAFYTLDDRYFGKVVEVTDKGVQIEGCDKFFDPRFMEVATDH